MLKGFFELILYGPDKHLLPSFIQQTTIQFPIKMLFLNLLAVQHSENHPVDDDGFEDF
jgi:hypothetical protein